MLDGMRSVGLDVGGTKVLGVLLDPAHPLDAVPGASGDDRVATPEGGDGLVEVLAELADRVGPDADAIGVGIPGLVNRNGRMIMGPHLRKLRNLDLTALLRERTGRATVIVDNDANCAALAEQRAGAARGFDDALVVTLGTGIGAGMVVDGRLVHGAAGFAGEAGHMVIDANGPPCPCGKRGCWERFASGTGLGRLARDAANGGRLDAAVELAGGDPEAVRGEHVTAAARAADDDALAVIGELAHWIALGLANLVNLLDPGIIVIGGGLVEAADLILPQVRRQFLDLVMAGSLRPEIPIVAAELGERAGALGAALLAADAAG
jgi:glucokinase